MAKRNSMEGGPTIFERLNQSREAKACEQFRARFPGEEPLPVEFNSLIADVMRSPGPIMIMKSNFEASLAGRVLTVFSRFTV